MRFMVIVKATKESEAGILPDSKMLAAMGDYNEQLAKAGVLLAMDGLQPSSKGIRLTFNSGERPSITDGPFAETKELIAGFWILQVKSKEEVIEWLSRAPYEGKGELEVRQIYEMEDFAGTMTAEMRAQEERTRSIAEGAK